MGRLRSGWLALAVVTALALGALGGCGGKKPAGGSVLPARITLNPSPSISVQLGSILVFTATAQNNTNTNVNPGFEFHSSNTSILNFSSNGVACAGTWNANFTICTPAATGMLQVTATAQGASSPPTLVFVHAPIDNITVTVAPSTNPPPTPEPCLSMGQTTTLQATAWSQNNDITATVGPFTWTAANTNVVKTTPIVDATLKVATNQATATAGNPGLTQIYASASGVSSSPFVQAAPFNNLNFFETCPVQSITLQLGKSVTTQTGQTSFDTTKGTAQSAVATVFDVLGNELTKAPLTWSSSNPIAVSGPSSCTTQPCSITTANPGSGSVTASCTPPTCNSGFPLSPIPAGLPSAFVPVPVYANTAISGLVSGTTSASSVLATSQDCKGTAPQFCTVYLYDIPTNKNISGIPTPMPTPPNSLMFDLAGDKAYVGSQFGSFAVTVGNLGGSTNPFTSFGGVTGTVLAVSPNGNSAIFSDTIHTPNQVYVVNVSSTAATNATALNINGAVAARFSPDGLKAYIIADSGNSIYVYSSLQSLLNLANPPVSLPAGTGSGNLVAFSPNGAFAYIAGTPGGAPALTTLNVCNDQEAGTVPLDALPAFIASFPPLQQINAPDLPRLITLDSTGTVMDIVTATITVQTPQSTPPPSFPLGSCPQAVTHTVQKIALTQGTLAPIAFFMSPDGTQAYIVPSNQSSVLVYSFSTQSFSAIPLANNPSTGQSVTPLAASMANDGTQIYVAGNDGRLHQVSINPAADLNQISFPSLTNVTNPFCSSGSSSIACALNMVAVKP